MKEVNKKKQGIKRKTGVGTEYYIEGNAVRKVDTQIPQRETDGNEFSKKKKSIRKRQENTTSMSFSHLMTMSVAMLVVLVLCVNYISIQSKLTSIIRQTQIKESELENLKNENDAAEADIALYVDLDHIYDVATNRLGMIYAKKSQVITYEKTESEYVRQFEDIPK
jgi:hypothetical protein